MKISHDIKRQSGWRKNVHRWLSQRSPLGFALNRFQWHFYPRFVISKRYPIHMDIELSSACQLHCPMCFREHREIPKQNNMRWETFKKIIDEAEGRVYSLKFTGRGEPLLNRQFPKFMDYLKARKFGEVGMITNGQLMTEEVMHAMIDNGMDFVAFSVDGLKDDYERIRAPMKYEEIIGVVRRLWEIRKEKGATKPLIRIQSVDRYVGDGREFLETWQPISDDILFLFFKDYAEGATNVQMQGYACPYIYQRMMIHWDGTVPMCVNDEYESAVRGSLTESSLRSIWNGDLFTEARRNHEKGERDKHYECCGKCCVNREGHGEESVAAKAFMTLHRGLSLVRSLLF